MNVSVIPAQKFEDKCQDDWEQKTLKIHKAKSSAYNAKVIFKTIRGLVLNNVGNRTEKEDNGCIDPKWSITILRKRYKSNY